MNVLPCWKILIREKKIMKKTLLLGNKNCVEKSLLIALVFSFIAGLCSPLPALALLLVIPVGAMLEFYVAMILGGIMIVCGLSHIAVYVTIGIFAFTFYGMSASIPFAAMLLLGSMVLAITYYIDDKKSIPPVCKKLNNLEIQAQHIGNQAHE
jgi:hypothetical protein